MSPLNEKQPIPVVMNSTKCPIDHANQPHCEHNTSCQYYTRLRRTIIPTTFLLVTIAVLLFLLFGDMSSGIGAGGEGLFRRAANGTNSPFVHNKLYLIVVIVGLVVVLFAAIALSFWCCKSSFENPCCCPCYLCACCGGLACLECISCGLCADALA